MKTYFIDTNLFIRYLANDDTKKADRVEQLLVKAAHGQLRLFTAEMVIAEVVWVMESFYRIPKMRIAEMVNAILATPGLEVQNGKSIKKAAHYYPLHNIDFIDAYIVALMEEKSISSIFSFDKKHLKRIQTIDRVEP